MAVARLCAEVLEFLNREVRCDRCKFSRSQFCQFGIEFGFDRTLTGRDDQSKDSGALGVRDEIVAERFEIQFTGRDRSDESRSGRRYGHCSSRTCSVRRDRRVYRSHVHGRTGIAVGELDRVRRRRIGDGTD